MDGVTSNIHAEDRFCVGNHVLSRPGELHTPSFATATNFYLGFDDNWEFHGFCRCSRFFGGVYYGAAECGNSVSVKEFFGLMLVKVHPSIASRSKVGQAESATSPYLGDHCRCMALA